MGSSCRMFGEEPLARPMCFRNGALHQSPQPVHEGSRDPALWEPGGVLVLARKRMRRCALGWKVRQEPSSVSLHQP
jgi:hypothetical protein